MRVIVTGGAGFIGSAFVWRLNREGVDDVLIVDRLGTDMKWKNLVPLRFTDIVAPEVLLGDPGRFAPDAIVHMGACSATTERDADYLLENNYRYTRTLAEWATLHGVRFIYASSAATYGDGEQGFDDDPARIPHLAPINMYGYSKQLFDAYALRTGLLDKMVGLKFFNVFGPNEYHKVGMVSMVYRAFHQAQAEGVVRLFRSYRPEYPDGGQVRDFIYVKDVVDAMYWLLAARPNVNGLFNLGTGTARSWNDLANAVFAALGKPPKIEYIPMPDALVGQYQYFTEAKMDRLRAAGCPVEFGSLEGSVSDYVRGYLLPGARPLHPEAA
jgi:ADP-L-glycero-D-manno-heptose 6-epimerase